MRIVQKEKKKRRRKCQTQLSEKSKEKSYPQMTKAFYLDLLPAAKQKPSQ